MSGVPSDPWPLMWEKGVTALKAGRESATSGGPQTQGA